MPRRITQLKLTNFRGATQPVEVRFDPQKSIVVIFGENGTGKSTLVDAIDAIGNGSFGSLEREGVRPNPHKYVVSLNQPPRSLEVELTVAAGHSWTATISGKNVVVKEQAAGQPRPTILVLRRRELLKLIEAQPAKRYEAIQSFIDVATVDKAEAALRMDVNTVQQQLNAAMAAKTQAEKSLRVLWEQERQPAEAHLQPLDWAARRTAEDLTALKTRAGEMIQVPVASEHLAATLEGWQSGRTKLTENAKQLQQAEETLAGVTSGADNRRAALIDLLNAAQRYLAPPAMATSCPLCAGEIAADEVRQQLARQLAALHDEEKLLRDVATARTNLALTDKECQRQGQAVLRNLQGLVARLAASQPVAAQPLGREWATLLTELQAAQVTDELGEQAAKLSQQLASVGETLQQEADELSSRVTLYDNIRAQAQLLRDSDQQVAELQLLLHRLEGVCQVVVRTRRDFIQAILDDIIGEVNRLFSAIHPGEKIGLHRLEMDEAKRASLEQHAQFEDVAGVVPQAYFSESHLDTFGFCLWLALAKRSEPQHTVLVLDDVFTSVDVQHFRRISELLADEAAHFQQLIIATHNRHWHEIYRQHGVGVHLLKLERWTLARGLRPHEDQVLAADLAAALEAEPFNRQAVASQAGILLENVLDTLALTYGCRLPRKHGHAYTLGELMSSTSKLLRKAIVRRVDRDGGGQPLAPESWTETPLSSLFEQVNELTFIRNEVGAHFNSAAADLPDEDIRIFGEAALKLAQALACPTCGHLPQGERSDHRGCRCPRHQTQLRPLMLP